MSFFKKLKRTLGQNWHKDPGCKAQPLFDIPLDHVIVDELHMFLRVTDILEKGVILEVINWDEVKHCLMIYIIYKSVLMSVCCGSTLSVFEL